MQAELQTQGYLYTFAKGSFIKEHTQSGSSKKSSQKNKKVVTVLHADDHPYLIHGVESDLNKDPGIKIFGNACSYDEVLEKAAALQPDIVLLDLKMPGSDKHDFKLFMTGLRTLGKCKVIIFSNETGWPRIYRCLELGASAYVEKAISFGRLAEFIHRVYEEEELLIFTGEQMPDVNFVGKKKEILNYIVDGKENNEISVLLNLELKTIQSYVNEIKTKLSQVFGIHPLKSRTFLLLATRLGYGHKVN